MSAVLDLPLDQVHVKAKRLRTLDPEKVEVLVNAIAYQGLLQPIVAIPRPRGGWWLVAGLYRLEAVRRLEWSTVPARLLDNEGALATLEAEAYENLSQIAIPPLDRCRALAELRAVHVATHPGSRRGGDRRSAAAKARLAARSNRKDCGLIEGAASYEDGAFAVHVARRADMSARAVELCLTIWNGLSSSSRDRLDKSDLRDNQSELHLLSRQSHQRQSDALDLILDREHPADNVAAALASLDGAGDVTQRERQFLHFVQGFKRLSEPELDHILTISEDVVIASLRRRGRI